MRQPGGKFDFTQEPFGANVGRHVGLQDLDRHVAFVTKIARREHDGHTALTEFSSELVPAGKAVHQPLLEDRHWAPYNTAPGSRRTAGPIQCPPRNGWQAHLSLR